MGSQNAFCFFGKIAVHCKRGKSGSPRLGSLHLSYQGMRICFTHALLMAYDVQSYIQ